MSNREVDVPPDAQQWIESKLSALYMVNWDRFTTGEWFGQQPYITVYGWIDRADEYKDFVVVHFWLESQTCHFTTSSEEHTEEIYRRLFDADPDAHNECKRVEHTFEVDNAIELGATQ